MSTDVPAETTKRIFNDDGAFPMYDGRDLSPHFKTLYNQYFTLNIDDDQSRKQLFRMHYKLKIPNKVDFTLINAHGSFSGNNFIKLPKNVIVLVHGEEGHLLYDQQQELSPEVRVVGYAYMMLFIQFLHFLCTMLQGAGAMDKQMVIKYWPLYRKSIQDYWSLNAPGPYFSHDTMHRILPYFEGDLLPDTGFDFKDPNGYYFGAYRWYEYDKRMRLGSVGLEPYSSINKQHISSYFSPTLEGTFGLFLDKKYGEMQGTQKLAIIMMSACRIINSPYVDICLLPAKMTIFKNLLHDYNKLIRSTAFIEGDMDLSVYEKYGFGLKLLTDSQSTETLDILRKMLGKVFTEKETNNKNNSHVAVKDRLLRIFITRMFYSKYCFSNNRDEILSAYKKNHIVTFHDAMTTPKDLLKKQLTRRFINVYVPVRDVRGIPCYFGFTESFPGAEHFGQPTTVAPHLYKLPIEQMYYYTNDRQARMLAILFDKNDKRSLAINNLVRFGYIYGAQDRKKIFDLWASVAQPLIKASLWQSFADAMNDLFVEGMPMSRAEHRHPLYTEFFRNYKLFYLQWPKKGFDMDVPELLTQPWLAQLFENNPWQYYYSTVIEIGSWRHMRRGLKVAYLTPLEYALCNFYLYGDAHVSTLTLYELVSQVCAENRDQYSGFYIGAISRQDLISTAREIAYTTETLYARNDAMVTAENLIDHISFLLNERRYVNLVKIPLSILTRLRLTDYFTQDFIAKHIISRLPKDLVYRMNRDYIIADYSQIFTVQHGMISMLESLTDYFFKENPERDRAFLLDIFDFYLGKIYIGEKFMTATVPEYKKFETFNFFQLLFLEQELARYR